MSIHVQPMKNHLSIDSYEKAIRIEMAIPTSKSMPTFESCAVARSAENLSGCSHGAIFWLPTSGRSDYLL
jgi:hypothetical protein